MLCGRQRRRGCEERGMWECAPSGGTHQPCARQRVGVTSMLPPPAGTSLQALQRVHDPYLVDEKRRFLGAANADMVGGRKSTGVRGWITFCVFGLKVSPIPDPLDTSFEHRRMVEERLEDFAVWYAVCRPSGRQASHKSIGKYVSSVRAWYKRNYRTELGLGARGARISDILKGYGRVVDQPPPMERIGCAPADLALGMQAALESEPDSVRCMWRAALTFGMSAMARACEIAIDKEQHEVFDGTQHMTARDVAAVVRGGQQHAAVRMRKRKNLKVLRGKDHTVMIAAGGAHFDAAECLFEWLAVRRAAGVSDDKPLFCHASGASITTEEVRRMVRRVMEAAGRDPKVYGGHSLRIGGATAAHAAGVPPSLIRLMGRWSSDIYEIYCRLSLESALGVGQAIASAQVTATAEAFHDENLEMLPSEMAQLDCVFGELVEEEEEGEGERD